SAACVVQRRRRFATPIGHLFPIFVITEEQLDTLWRDIEVNVNPTDSFFAVPDVLIRRRRRVRDIAVIQLHYYVLRIAYGFERYSFKGCWSRIRLIVP